MTTVMKVYLYGDSKATNKTLSFVNLAIVRLRLLGWDLSLAASIRLRKTGFSFGSPQATANRKGYTETRYECLEPSTCISESFRNSKKSWQKADTRGVTASSRRHRVGFRMRYRRAVSLHCRACCRKWQSSRRWPGQWTHKTCSKCTQRDKKPLICGRKYFALSKLGFRELRFDLFKPRIALGFQ